MKTLYFEGAGMFGADISKNTIGNCRIRTAFHLDNGEPVYLEILASETNKYTDYELQKYKYIGTVDACCYYYHDDDENKHSIKGTRGQKFEYTKESILKFVNSLGASFDSIEVAPEFSGFKVFRSNTKENNFGDEFILDLDMTRAREAIYNEQCDIQRSAGEKYPCVSATVDENNPEILHIRSFRKSSSSFSINIKTMKIL